MNNILPFRELPACGEPDDLPILEKNVPLPKKRKTAGYGKWQRLIMASQPGDSLLVTEYERTAITKANRHLGNPRKIVTRAQDSIAYSHPSGKLRLWFLDPNQENTP